MKKLIIASLLCLFTLPAFAACPDPMPPATLCIEWEAPTQNVDGTPLTDLAGFQAYWSLTGIPANGPAPAGQMIDIPNPDQVQLIEGSGPINLPEPGPEGGTITLYLRMTAYDDDGNVSALSNQVVEEVVFPDTLPPDAPRVLTILINLT